MLRWFKIAFLTVLMILIVLVALANRELVRLELLPAELGALLPVSVEMPLFLVVLGSILIGLLIGYILEWLREHKHRRRATESSREATRLAREVQSLKAATRSEKDEILSLLN
jgi:uncharacterized integral membrane protein